MNRLPFAHIIFGGVWPQAALYDKQALYDSCHDVEMVPRASLSSHMESREIR